MPLLPQGPPQGGGLAMPPPDPMQAAAPGPVPLPPVPAEAAGMAAMQLVPVQQAQQAALTQQQTQELLGLLASQLGGAPNPAAEAAQGMPAGLVAPSGGAPVVPDPNDPFGGA